MIQFGSTLNTQLPEASDIDCTQSGCEIAATSHLLGDTIQVYCLSRRSRAMLYRVAAFTGLRAQELASLTPRSFDLDAQPPTVRVESCYSKHRRTDVLRSELDLVARLRDYLSSADNEQRLWPGRWYCKGARIIRQDLANARKAWLEEVPLGREREARDRSDYLRDKNRDGCAVDFHSLRHGFITYLVTANVSPKVAQTLARHSTITLTMDRYAHLGVNDLVDALKRLPVIASMRS